MSVRAYAITNIEDGPSVFHCRHEVEFIDLLREHQYKYMTVLCFDGGQIEINRGDIEEIKKTIKTRVCKEETKEIIAEIEKLFDESGKDFIVVDCF